MATKRNENADRDYLAYDWNAYCAAIADLHLPRFAEIPDIPLYMDQLIGYVGKQMEIFALPSEKPLTSSMVNNYVKMRLVPQPEAKRYQPLHVAYLILVCLAKRMYSMSDIERLVAIDVQHRFQVPDVYDRFIELAGKKKIGEHLSLVHDRESGATNAFAKIVDDRTLSVMPLRYKKYNSALWIDVFPVDGLGNTRISAILHYARSAFARELVNACSWRRYSASNTHGILFEPIRFVLFLLSRVISPVFLVERIESINKHRSFDTSGYAGCVSGSYRWKEILKTEAFQNYVDMHFENEEFKCIEQYDLYLKQHYGNYMELPPIDRQQTHHSFSAYRKDY